VFEKQGDNASRQRIGRIMQEALLVCKTKRRMSLYSYATVALLSKNRNHNLSVVTGSEATHYST